MMGSKGLRKGMLVYGEMYYLERKIVGTERIVFNYFGLKTQKLHEDIL
jgi:hypothetical protein